MKTTYYLILDRIVGKRVNEDKYYKDYLFKKGQWVPDDRMVIDHHLMGFDSSEPLDSPYRHFNGSVMSEIDVIPEDKAKQLMSKQTVNYLKEKWSNELLQDRWEPGQGYLARLVKTTFKLYGVDYEIHPMDLGLSNSCLDQGLMEWHQETIGRDLKEYGATEIHHYGEID